MKRTSIYCNILSGIILSLLFGCSLEEEILDESTGAELLDQDGIELNLLAPAYGSLTPVLSCCDVFALNEITSDEAVIPAKGLDWFDNGAWIKLHQHSWTPEHGVLLGAWTTMDNGVARANAGLLLMSEQSGSTPSGELQTMKAELRFLRAYYRYHLLDLFRQVPLRDEMDQNYNDPPPTFSGIEAFDWLVTELESILPDLKEHGVAPYGRVSRQAAHSLLAKLYINAEVYTGTAMWQETLQACDAIINSGHFGLADDYFQLFSFDNDEQNPEAIFVVRQSLETDNKVFFSPSFTLHYRHTLGMFKFTFNGWATVEDFYNRWDEDGDLNNGVSTTDMRFQDDRIKVTTGANLGFLEGPQINPDGSSVEDPQLTGITGEFVQLDYTPEIFSISEALQHEGVRVMKYNPDPQSNVFFVGRNDFLIFRYADIWLMKAEAMFRSGQTGALEMVNELRKKRGVSPLANLTEEDLLNERGFEFYWEGYRRQDLIRFGKFTADSWTFKNVSEEYRNVFPIPISILDINKNLIQNPGY